MMASRRFLNTLLVVVLIIFIVPPGWSLARDAILLARADPNERQEARYIVQRDVIRGSSRALEVRSIFAKAAPRANVNLPVIQPSMPRTDLTEALPACNERKPTLAPNLFRRLAVDEARFRQVDKVSSTAEIMTLNACVGATPFARYCANIFHARRDNVGDDNLIAELLLMGAVANRPGGVCWNSTITRQ